MDVQLVVLRDNLSRSLEELLDERDAAFAKIESAKVAVAQAEAERIGTVLATVQSALNENQALNLSAVAARLEESVQSQRAIGLRTAAETLAKAATRLRNASSQLSATLGGVTNGGQPATPSGAIQAKAGPFQSVVNALIAGAQDKGLDPMMVLTIVAIESDFKLEAASPLSSAGGLFQFLDDTWTGMGGKKFPGRGGKGNGHAAAAPLADQVDKGTDFIAEHVEKLSKKLSTPPTVTAIYMAHQQGLGGASKILTADPNAAIEDVIGDAAARNNGFAGLSVAQTISKFHLMVRTNEDEARAVIETTQQPPIIGTPTIIPAGSLARKAVDVALSEMEMFARLNGATITEEREPLARRVLEYFRFVGRSDIDDPQAEPWSAAFISFVIHSAGVTQDQFRKSQGHAKYILAGLANRMKNRLNAPIVYFDRDEVAPRVGDLVGFSRTGAVKNRADIEAFLSLPPKDQFFPSHTDLVVEESPGRIRAIGGNVSQTIKTTQIRLDANGRIDPSAEHFFLLRLNF